MATIMSTFRSNLIEVRGAIKTSLKGKITIKVKELKKVSQIVRAGREVVRKSCIVTMIAFKVFRVAFDAMLH